jgi:hypothetical protein
MLEAEPVFLWLLTYSGRLGNLFWMVLVMNEVA